MICLFEPFFHEDLRLLLKLVLSELSWFFSI